LEGDGIRMAMNICKECKKEISSKAKKCPHCGVDTRNWFMRHKFLSFLGAIVIIVIISVSAGGGKKDTTASVSNGSNAQKAGSEVVAKVGDVIKTDKFEITITSIEEKSKVGSEFISAKPSDGGTYIAINWQYKNISDKPIGSFSTPSIELLDKNKTKYDSDINASSSYATEVKLDSKILSDLNPGITVKDAKVFEISKEQYKAGGWRLDIKSDKEAFIHIN
jgi:hypothetical protein